MRILAGRFKGRPLPVPDGARPAGGRLRTSLFGVLSPRLVGARVLDVCAGAGGFGLEALSRGALEVVLLDSDPRAVAALSAWLLRVGAAREGRALRGDALRQPWPPGPFELVFLDPPFSAWGGAGGDDLVERARPVLAPDGLLVLKVPARHPVEASAGWALLDRRAAGDAAFVLLSPR